MADDTAFFPYPDIERLGPIGDRRTAAMVAADGTIGWLCLPDFDAPPVLGSLLDAQRGGFWRVGPRHLAYGVQRYLTDTMALATRWTDADGDLELIDVMAWPEDDRPGELVQHRAVLRELRCHAGRVDCVMALAPRANFEPVRAARALSDGAVFDLDGRRLSLWTTMPVTLDGDEARAAFTLSAGESVWWVLTLDEPTTAWSVARAERTREAAVGYWRGFVGRLKLPVGSGMAAAIKRSALVLHFGQYAPTGAFIAAPTASLPERVGADLNWDYRFTWLRDASLSASALMRLGVSAERYLDWVAGLTSLAETPLQVVYRASGDPHLSEALREDLAGYRHSRPVRFGNRAVGQFQLGSPGYLLDTLARHLASGGFWKPAYSALVQRVCDDTIARWRDDDSGIWELPGRLPYVEGKVMAWVVLDRACQIGTYLGETSQLARYAACMAEIHAEVMARGWSARRQSFTQRYDADALDAAVLLIPIMGFLPSDHPRVKATVEAIAAHLAPDGFVHRFDPRESPGMPRLSPLAFEGSFMPCTYWLATCQALAGDRPTARAILARCDNALGSAGTVPEELATGGLHGLGNTPLLFAHAEHIRAALALHPLAGGLVKGEVTGVR